MNDVYEIELNNVRASFISSEFDLVLGVENLSALTIEQHGSLKGFTDFDWQIMYARVLVDDRWYFLPQSLYDELDEKFSDRIGDLIWRLSNKV